MRISRGRCGVSFGITPSRQRSRWDGIENGDLLDIAQAEFGVVLTTDKSIKYQQNLTGRDIAVITLRAFDNRLPKLTPLMPQVLALLPAVEPGRVYMVEAEDEQPDVEAPG